MKLLSNNVADSIRVPRQDYMYVHRNLVPVLTMELLWNRHCVHFFVLVYESFCISRMWSCSEFRKLPYKILFLKMDVLTRMSTCA